NKILGRVARAVFLSFEESRRFFGPRKVVMSGNPVRRALVEQLAGASGGPAGEDARAGIDGAVHVLVSGGSQGAVAVNELASQALIALAAADPARRIAVVHQ